MVDLQYCTSFEYTGFPGDSAGKESACNVGNLGLIPGLGRYPWRRDWLPTPVFFPGEFHGQRSPEGYSPWGYQESDMTEQLNTQAPSLFSSWPRSGLT